MQVPILKQGQYLIASIQSALSDADLVQLRDAIVLQVGKLRSRGVIPTVVALRQSFEATRRTELDRLDFKLSTLPPEVREEARTRVDEITHLLVEKLLLTPTEQLKSIADPETATLYAEAIARVFNLAEAAAERDAGLGARDSGSEARQENRVEPFSRAKSRHGPGRAR